jgi:hypothetical protein
MTSNPTVDRAELTTEPDNNGAGQRPTRIEKRLLPSSAAITDNVNVLCKQTVATHAVRTAPMPAVCKQLRTSR